MSDVLIVSPARPDELLGNAVTANRWAAILGRLGRDVEIAQEYDGQPCDMLVALHARRSAPSIERFAREHPGRPLLVALTGTDIYRDIHRDAAARRSLELATRLVVLHGRGGDALPDHLRGRVRSIYQSVDVPESRPSRAPTGFQVCVLSHLRPVKDPFLTARAARLLPGSSTIHIVHLGRALSPEMEAAARAEVAANPRYEWRGELPRDEALHVLAGSQLHVLTSQLEGGANVVGEAVALGVPTLSTEIAGSVGLLGEDYPGYFPVGDARALATLLDRAETDPHLLGQLRDACARRAHLFRPEVELAAWRDLLDEIDSSSS